ncbi:MAG: proline dehydrogenase family protein [Nitrososphaerota archaeon]|nr:proline dehydrogenase family protein [Nitrososphaerota archaeon]
MPSPLLRLARQWIAGEKAEDGIKRVREANSRGILGLLNLLGEHIESREQIAGTLKEYSKLLDLIEDSKVDSQISIKPTQMGLNLDFDFCLANYMEMVEKCKTHSNNWLWIDMENVPYIQKTIDLYTRVLAKHPNTGIAIQSYLKRSEQDLQYLLPLGANVRLVKGAYNESPEFVFKDKKQISDNYGNLMRLMFERGDRNFVAVATHDGKLVDLAKDLGKSGKVRFEFEMLMGVRDNLKMELVSQHYQVREYIPYGPQWLSYSIRRIREKKSNILLLGRSIFTA